MSSGRSVPHREVEQKLRVDDEFVMPDLRTLADAEPGPPFTMRAVYHDTARLTLFRWGITLRRREGGTDEGWHMKLPVAGADGTTRDEVHAPLSEGTVGNVPGTLVETISPLLREQPLVPLLTLITQRTPTVLKDPTGRPLVEVVDDRVTVLREGQPPVEFRELEVEAVDGQDPDALRLMAKVARRLQEAGGQPSSVSKAASALGARTKEPPDVPDLPMPRPDDLAVDAIRAVMCRHVRHLLMADVAVRRDLPDSVHQMRVAARRLRSALATFAPLIDPARSAALREELKWIASELGIIRDTEVMIERLDEHAGRLDDPIDTDRARAAIDPMLNRRLAAARSSALAALRSDRHQQLIDDLMTAAIDPPVTDAAFRRCDDVLPPLVARTWRRLEKAVDELELDGPSVTWHEARIKAKRARYAAESVAEVFGRRMTRHADRLSEVTDLLGDHQDAHVAQTILRELAVQVDGETGMSLGLLHAFEADEEILDRLRFAELWPKAVKAARRARLERS